jgi:hypothetical protein
VNGTGLYVFFFVKLQQIGRTGKENILCLGQYSRPEHSLNTGVFYWFLILRFLAPGCIDEGEQLLFLGRFAALFLRFIFNSSICVSN